MPLPDLNDPGIQALGQNTLFTGMSPDHRSLAYLVPSKTDGQDGHVVRFYPYADFEAEDWTCDCKGFHYNHERTLKFKCSHIRGVLAKLVGNLSVKRALQSAA